jgi:hypothetical protein
MSQAASMPMSNSSFRASFILSSLAAVVGGCGSDGGGGGAGPDTQAPAVSITAPVANVTVAGDVVVSATATDDDAVVGVQFRLDGQPLDAEDTQEPYEVT